MFVLQHKKSEIFLRKDNSHTIRFVEELDQASVYHSRAGASNAIRSIKWRLSFAGKYQANEFEIIPAKLSL